MTSSKLQGRGAIRRQAMLDAATQLFMEKGYERTSLADILELSKGSRSTLYDHFGSKDGLFQAIVERTLTDIRAAFTATDDIPILDEDGLVLLGLRFMDRVLEPVALKMYRVLVAECHRLPELGKFFLDSSQKDIEEHLAGVFRAKLPAAQKAPELSRELAIFFLWTVSGDIHLQYTMGIQQAMTPEEMEKLIRTRVRLFLHGANASIIPAHIHASR